MNQKIDCEGSARELIVDCVVVCDTTCQTSDLAGKWSLRSQTSNCLADSALVAAVQMRRTDYVAGTSTRDAAHLGIDRKS